MRKGQIGLRMLKTVCLFDCVWECVKLPWPELTVHAELTISRLAESHVSLAYKRRSVLPPCGQCRELQELIIQT